MDLRLDRNCNYCGKVYPAKVRYLKYNRGIYCSRKCAQTDHKRPTIEERFWPQVDKRGPDECWVFTGRTNGDGYGQINGFRKNQGAHRVSYIMHFGDIPKGKVVMHTCDNPPCVNPNHFKLGTQVENIYDMVAKGRNKNGGKGSESIMSALTKEQRLEIKSNFNGQKGYKSQTARQYGVCPQTICNVLSADYV